VEKAKVLSGALYFQFRGDKDRVSQVCRTALPQGKLLDVDELPGNSRQRKYRLSCMKLGLVYFIFFFFVAYVCRII